MLEKQAGWRTDPKRSGAAGCFGDIGTHAYNLGRFITGLLPDQDFVPLRDLRARPRAGRLRHGRHQLHQRRPRHGHRVADLAWAGKRPVDRGGRHEGVAGMASGGAEQDARPLTAASRTRSTRATRMPAYLTPTAEGLVPAAERPSGGVFRGVRQRLQRRLRRHGRAGPPARSSTPPTASIPTSATAWTA